MAAEGGPAVDLRDDKTVRALFFHMLVDWDGSDLKKVYEPLTDQFGYLFSAWLLILMSAIVYGLYKKWDRKRRETPLPYKVIKPPVNLVDASAAKSSKRRVVAVMGATGFVGSHVVKRLVDSEEYVVYMLGRRFNDEKIHPMADAVFQADMMNYEGLLSAFSGVDSVIHAAAAIPNVHISDDELWRINVVGSENVLSAAQKCGVKSLVFVTGLKVAGEVQNKTAKIFINALTHIEQVYLDANGKHGMQTCAVGFGHIYGLNTFHEKVLSGQINRLPLVDNRVSFIPVSFAAEVAIKAEQKLSSNSKKVAGQFLPIEGYPGSFKQFFTRPQWGHKIQDTSVTVLHVMAKINNVIAMVSGFAPFGNDLCPAVASFFDMSEEEFDDSISQSALELDNVPTLEDGIEELKKELMIKKEMKKTK